MQNLNDLSVFVAIVDNGSFSAAADSLGMARSQISHCLARLEKRLGLRLLQRTTRQQRLTEIGRCYYECCRRMLDEANRAQQIVDLARAKPAGSLRVVTPPLFSELILGPIIVDFMDACPDVHVAVDQTYREVDVVSEGYDVAFRLLQSIPDSSLVVRSMGLHWQVLVASPRLLDGRMTPLQPDDVQALPSLAMASGRTHGRFTWQLRGAQGQTRVLEHRPRLVSDDLLTLRAAAVAGHGAVALPKFLCARELATDELRILLPHWSLHGLNVHAVYPSRHGQTPALHSFLDFVTPRIEAKLHQLHTSDDFGAAREPVA